MVGSAASSNRAQEMACAVVSNPAAKKMPALAARVCTGMGPPSLWLTKRLRQAHSEVSLSGCTPRSWMMAASSSSFCSVMCLRSGRKMRKKTKIMIMVMVMITIMIRTMMMIIYRGSS